MMDDNMTILDDKSTPRLLDSGSSVLILESVSGEDEGTYFCHVSFNGVSLLTSVGAQLTFNGEEAILAYVYPTRVDRIQFCTI